MRRGFGRHGLSLLTRPASWRRALVHGTAPRLKRRQPRFWRQVAPENNHRYRLRPGQPQGRGGRLGAGPGGPGVVQQRNPGAGQRRGLIAAGVGEPARAGPRAGPRPAPPRAARSAGPPAPAADADPAVPGRSAPPQGASGWPCPPRPTRTPRGPAGTPPARRAGPAAPPPHPAGRTYRATGSARAARPWARGQPAPPRRPPARAGTPPGRCTSSSAMPTRSGCRHTSHPPGPSGTGPLSQGACRRTTSSSSAQPDNPASGPGRPLPVISRG